MFKREGEREREKERERERVPICVNVSIHIAASTLPKLSPIPESENPFKNRKNKIGFLT